MVERSAKALAPPATHDLDGRPLPSRTGLIFHVVGPFEATAAEYEAMVARHADKPAVDPDRLHVHYRFDPWESMPPREPEPEPPPLAPRAVPRSEPEPAASVPGSGLENVWPRWF